MHRLLSFAAAIGAAGLMLVPAVASAQTAPGPYAAPTAPAAAPQHRGTRGLRYMRALRALNLTDAQKQQIRTIVRNQEQATRTQIDGVLTPDQRAQLRSSLRQ